MSTYPKLIYTCEGDGIWILGPGPNPPAEIRNSKGERLTPTGLTLASIAGHTDLRDWDEVVEPPPPTQSSEMDDQNGHARGSTVPGKSDRISQRRSGAAGKVGRRTTKMATKTKSKATKSTRGADKGKLELVPRTLAELPVMLIGRLYFAPQAYRKKLTAKEETLRANAGVNTYRFLRDNVWSAEERVVNKCLEGMLMAAPPAAVAAAIKAVAATAGLVSPVLCKLRYPKQLNKVVGEPDFMLWDAAKSALVIGEIKIGAKPSNGRYSVQQLMKYMRLGLLARGSLGVQSATHLIVVPDGDFRRHCSDSDYWLPTVANDGRLGTEVPNNFLTYQVEYGMVADESARLLEVMDAESVRGFVQKRNPLIPIDTFVTSWKTLCGQLSKSCEATHAGHLIPAMQVLQRLGEGRFAETATGGPD